MNKRENLIEFNKQMETVKKEAEKAKTIAEKIEKGNINYNNVADYILSESDFAIKESDQEIRKGSFQE